MKTTAVQLPTDELEAIRAFQEKVRRDVGLADRQPTVSARWLGSSRTEIDLNGTKLNLGGEGEFNAMQAVLGSLAACDIDMIALHAGLMGLPLDEITIEASGTFNVARYLGIGSDIESGYQSIEYRVRIRAPRSSERELEQLRQLCERVSPVGETLKRAITVVGVVELAS